VGGIGQTGGKPSDSLLLTATPRTRIEAERVVQVGKAESFSPSISCCVILNGCLYVSALLSYAKCKKLSLSENLNYHPLPTANSHTLPDTP
jgi:hypothetical protein